MIALHPSESRTQQMLLKWWSFAHKAYQLPEFALMGFPLQGARSARNGARLKAEGMRAGTPDLFLAAARQNKAGLWIEMKTPIGRLTETQKEFQAYLNGPYLHKVCRSFEEAKAAIEAYLR
jgi:hypothetical protein